MSSATMPRVGIAAGYNPNRLFFLSCLALIAAAFVFALRTEIMADLGTAFGLTAGEVGGSVGAAFLAFGISCVIGSPLCDFLGMGRLLTLACFLHVGGVLMTIFAPNLLGLGIVPAVQLIFASQFICGLAHGLVEAVINPLAATIYPDNKTHKLNVLHAWWPGGLVMGSLLAGLLTTLGMNWQVKFGFVLLPVAIYGSMLIGQKFPPTERVASNVSNVEMFREVLKPAFLLLVFAMLFTACLELAPAQWTGAVLTRTVGFQGIYVLAYVSGLMFLFRFFAGALAHKFSPIGLMWLSSILAGLGLLALSFANNWFLGLLAATLWAMGVCYMWPTMLGITSERFPRGGALAMGMIGAAGSAIIIYGLKTIGEIYDHFTQKALPPGADLKQMLAEAASNPAVNAQIELAKNEAAPFAFRYVGLLAVVPVVIFGAWWVIDKNAGGYKAIKLTQADPADFSADAVLEADAAPS